MKMIPWFFVAVALSLTGCSSINTALNAKGSGETKYIDAPIPTVWPELQTAVVLSGGTVNELRESEKIILADYGGTASSWGEYVAVFCTPKGKGTQVEVVSKPKLKTNITYVRRGKDIWHQLHLLLKEKGIWVNPM